MRRRFLKLVILKCRACSAILFTDLQVRCIILHCCHGCFHDEILHQGITYTYAWQNKRHGTYGSPFPVVFKTGIRQVIIHRSQIPHRTLFRIQRIPSRPHQLLLPPRPYCHPAAGRHQLLREPPDFFMSHYKKFFFQGFS